MSNGEYLPCERCGTETLTFYAKQLAKYGRQPLCPQCYSEHRAKLTKQIFSEAAHDDRLWEIRKSKDWNDEAANNQFLDAVLDKTLWRPILRHWQQQQERREAKAR